MRRFEAVYPIIIIGITISFAGSASMKDRSITPSSPSSEANGFRKFAACVMSEAPPKYIFDRRNIIMPHGAATHAALPSTNRVLSLKLCTRVCMICG